MNDSKVIISVISCPDERCECHYHKGDSWEMNSFQIPGGLCVGAMSALLPWLTCIKYGAHIPWSKNGKIEVCCSDADYPVTFQLEIREENEIHLF